MKRTFTKEYVMDNRGCYSTEQVEALKCLDSGSTTLHQLYKELPIKDFCWFLVKKCDLTTKQKRLFALHCAELVLPIYQEQYPNDKGVRNCIETTRKYINGDCDRGELIEARSAAANAAADAAATAAATAAAYAYTAATAAATAATAYTAAAYAYTAADAYAYTAATAYTAAEFKQKIWEYVKTIK